MADEIILKLPRKRAHLEIANKLASLFKAAILTVCLKHKPGKLWGRTRGGLVHEGDISPDFPPSSLPLALPCPLQHKDALSTHAAPDQVQPAPVVQSSGSPLLTLLSASAWPIATTPCRAYILHSQPFRSIYNLQRLPVALGPVSELHLSTVRPSLVPAILLTSVPFSRLSLCVPAMATFSQPIQHTNLLRLQSRLTCWACELVHGSDPKH